MQHITYSKPIISYLLSSRYYSGIVLNKPLKIKKGPEITIYIKGFLSKGEESQDFHRWLTNHHKLVLKNKWNESSIGWKWPTGSLKHPIPMISGSNILFALFNSSKLLRANPWTFAGGVAIDAGLYASMMMYQYYAIEENTELLAPKLAHDLIKYSKNYSKVRIVSHSLGCKLLINALADVPDKYKPNIIHMCAPAFSEDKYEHILNNLAKQHTFLYYTPKDTILSTFLQIYKNKQPVGAYGLTKQYLNLTTIDVSNYFDNYWLVHNNYNRVFHKFIQNDNIEQLLITDKKKLDE